MTVTLRHRIIELLSRDIHNLFSISDIAKSLGVAYSHAHTFVKALAKEDIIHIKKVGNVSVCSLNLKSQLALAYLALIEARKTAEWKLKNPQSEKITEKIEQVKDSVHSVLIKGNRIIIIVPENITGVDFSIFRNRTVMNRTHFTKNMHYYKDSVVLHGAEKLWSLIGK